ncbi:hypothetical protein EDC04DRAFT_2760878 [Pisolithus marmoratus]|nr:hypothetical protein EDC04DRAFT_2760878 [Pisolithus marmoratus]
MGCYIDGSVLAVVSEVVLLGWLWHGGCQACLRRNERLTRRGNVTRGIGGAPCGELPDGPGCIDAAIERSVTAGSGCKAAAPYPCKTPCPFRSR